MSLWVGSVGWCVVGNLYVCCHCCVGRPSVSFFSFHPSSNCLISASRCRSLVSTAVSMCGTHRPLLSFSHCPFRFLRSPFPHRSYAYHLFYHTSPSPHRPSHTHTAPLPNHPFATPPVRAFPLPTLPLSIPHTRKICIAHARRPAKNAGCCGSHWQVLASGGRWSCHLALRAEGINLDLHLLSLPGVCDIIAAFGHGA